jgi:hypothetical protein
MPIDIPSVEQLASISRWHNLDLSDEDLREMQQLMRDGLASLKRVEALEEPKNPVVDNRDRG